MQEHARKDGGQAETADSLVRGKKHAKNSQIIVVRLQQVYQVIIMQRRPAAEATGQGHKIMRCIRSYEHKVGTRHVSCRRDILRAVCHMESSAASYGRFHCCLSKMQVVSNRSSLCCLAVEQGGRGKECCNLQRSRRLVDQEEHEITCVV